jgi:hypothetical protein
LTAEDKVIVKKKLVENLGLKPFEEPRADAVLEVAGWDLENALLIWHQNTSAHTQSNSNTIDA